MNEEEGGVVLVTTVEVLELEGTEVVDIVAGAEMLGGWLGWMEVFSWLGVLGRGYQGFK